MGNFWKLNRICVVFDFHVPCSYTQHSIEGEVILDMIHEFWGEQRRKKTLSADSRCVLRFRFVCIRCCVSNLITKPGGIFASFCQIYCQMCSRCDFARVQAEIFGRTIRSFAPVFRKSPWFQCKPLEIIFNWFPAQSTNRIIYEHLILEFPRRRRSVSLIDPISALKQHWWANSTGETRTIRLH